MLCPLTQPRSFIDMSTVSQIQHCRWGVIRAEARQHAGNAFRVSHRSEGGVNSRSSHRREELSEIDMQHDVLSRMWRKICGNRTPLAKGVCCSMRRNVVENPREDSSLKRLESRLWGLEQPLPAGRFWQPAVPIVTERSLGGPSARSFRVPTRAIRKPLQFTHRDLKPGSKLGDGGNRGNRPQLCSPFSRLHLARPSRNPATESSASRYTFRLGDQSPSSDIFPQVTLCWPGRSGWKCHQHSINQRPQPLTLNVLHKHRLCPRQ